MSDDEIKTFITTFKSFMEQASVSELNYLRRESNRKYREMYYTNQAKKVLEGLMAEGINPDDIRAIPD